MLPQQTTGSHRKRAPLIILGLLIINGGVFHIFGQQIASPTSAQSVVKDEQVNSAAAGELTTNTVAEEPVSSEEEVPIVTIYTVASGDTLSGIAEKFSISSNTIRWANDLSTTSTIRVGQKLTILPVTGIQYTVKSGDTISGIANKFKADGTEILEFNDLEDAGKIKIGMSLIIPDAELAIAPAKVVAKPKTVPVAPKVAPKVTAVTATQIEEKETEEPKKVVSTSTSLANPLPGSVLTQGRHGSNGVDFGAPVGTTVRAAADGEVISALTSCTVGKTSCGGGYGNYIIIQHANGKQTLYAHLSKLSVVVGDTVSKSDAIGKSGNTGRSTGPHLHFEVRGGTNPWTQDKKGTHY